MGAVTALLYLQGCTFIKAVVLDSPFASFKSLVHDMAAKITKIPSIIVNAAYKLLKSTVKTKAKFNLSDLNPEKAVPFLTVPAFFVVGVDDNIIPVQHTLSLF